mmetsp:Transcript_147307/g.410357  ORF Transcript_147307/g.410357 Transcript_147307/m.410357 type:complete len:294 (-) Transcript_147307:25-906(-)
MGGKVGKEPGKRRARGVVPGEKEEVRLARQLLRVQLGPLLLGGRAHQRDQVLLRLPVAAGRRRWRAALTDAAGLRVHGAEVPAATQLRDIIPQAGGQQHHDRLHLVLQHVEVGDEGGGINIARGSHARDSKARPSYGFQGDRLETLHGIDGLAFLVQVLPLHRGRLRDVHEKRHVGPDGAQLERPVVHTSLASPLLTLVDQQTVVEPASLDAFVAHALLEACRVVARHPLDHLGVRHTHRLHHCGLNAHKGAVLVMPLAQEGVRLCSPNSTRNAADKGPCAARQRYGRHGLCT